MKGKIFADYWVQCGKCEEMRSLTTRNKAVANRVVRDLGYRLTRVYGWVCPGCQEPEQEIENPRRV